MWDFFVRILKVLCCGFLLYMTISNYLNGNMLLGSIALGFLVDILVLSTTRVVLDTVKHIKSINLAFDELVKEMKNKH